MGRERQAGSCEEGLGRAGRTGRPPAEFILCKAYRPRGHIACEEGTRPPIVGKPKMG